MVSTHCHMMTKREQVGPPPCRHFASDTFQDYYKIRFSLSSLPCETVMLFPSGLGLILGLRSSPSLL